MAEKEYIEREALQNKAFGENHPTFYDGQDIADWYEKCINETAAADVSPVRHGRWVRKKALIQCDLCGFGLFPDGYFFKNGECTHSNEPSYRHNFCPHCGAKMDEEEQN